MDFNITVYHFLVRYAKVNEALTNCSIGAKINLPSYEEDNAIFSIKDSSPFFGQIGPVYLFNDAITSEQVQGIHSLGPSYMYSFLDNEVSIFLDNPLPGGILDAKDGLSSRIIFGLNAQVNLLMNYVYWKFLICLWFYRSLIVIFS